MNKTILLLIFLFSINSAFSKDDWISLFDGSNTDHWENPYDWGDYKIEGNELHLTTKTKNGF